MGVPLGRSGEAPPASGSGSPRQVLDLPTATTPSSTSAGSLTLLLYSHPHPEPQACTHTSSSPAEPSGPFFFPTQSVQLPLSLPSFCPKSWVQVGAKYVCDPGHSLVCCLPPSSLCLRPFSLLGVYSSTRVWGGPSLLLSPYLWGRSNLRNSGPSQLAGTRSRRRFHLAPLGGAALTRIG